ncbi:hypothetical protein M436DRAFT_50941 [Aureobasidium namibiae CBS 147.97]|uniref:Uncharacterized protein n=1 Tax=Aureobasidium namibiae CBS 147.97 TaxID=1043004 RepID=A0A074WI85_9PEZI
MADTKLLDAEQDVAAEDLWTLVKQLRVRDLVNAIKQITSDDFQHLANVARGRPLNLETFALLCKEFIKTRTGLALLSAVIAIICTIVISVYATQLPSPVSAGLRLMKAGPSAGKAPRSTATRSNSSVGGVIETLQSAVMTGYEDPVVVAFGQGTIVAGVIFAAYKLWNMDKNMSKRKNT